MPSWKYYSSPFTPFTAIETQLSERFFFVFSTAITWSSGTPVKIQVGIPWRCTGPRHSVSVARCQP